MYLLLTQDDLIEHIRLTALYRDYQGEPVR